MSFNNKIIIDLDNTITLESNKSYSDKDANNKIIKAIDLARKSNEILIFSSRNMKTFKSDLEKINTITKPEAIKWLNKHNIFYDEIEFGKPWAGTNGWYVDDRNLSLDEFIFKFTGPFCDQSFDLIIPFYNEEKNIINTYENTLKLEKLLNIKSYIFINNGSHDKTKLLLKNLKELNNKVQIIDIEKNIGYGNGIKAGLKKADSDYVLINHSDNQFDAYNFILTNMNDIKKIDAVIPIRLNRPIAERFFSFFLRLLMSIISIKLIKDFNGQPKILKLSKVRNISDLPDDFCIDYSFYRNFEDSYLHLPVIQLNRKEGYSSWKGDIFKASSIFFKYIYFCIKFKKTKKEL